MYQVPFLKSLVWHDLGLNPGLPDHWRTLYPLDQWVWNIHAFTLSDSLLVIWHEGRVHGLIVTQFLAFWVRHKVHKNIVLCFKRFSASSLSVVWYKVISKYRIMLDFFLLTVVGYKLIWMYCIMLDFFYLQ